MKTDERYWIVVVSKDHAMRGVSGGFMQANHGKPGPLKRIKKDDWVITYSPKQQMDGDEKLQAFTAIGQATDDEIYQYKMSETFLPFRRNIKFHDCNEVPILPLINDLEFIENKKSWGYKFRFGFFEIEKQDFELISKTMLKHGG